MERDIPRVDITAPAERASPEQRAWREYRLDCCALLAHLLSRMAERDDFVATVEPNGTLAIAARWGAGEVQGFLNLWLAGGTSDLLSKGDD